MDVSFDEYFFESQMEKEGKKLVQSLVEQGLAYESEGAIVINLEEYDLGVFLLLKSDGTALYSTKDLALAKIKFEKFKIDKSLYVVGSEQKFYFQQLFKTLELMGFEQAKKSFHLPYDLVTLEGGKISSREGELILAKELIDEVKETAEKGVKERHRDWNKEEIETVAKAISMAGIKFTMISQDNNKQIVFSINKILDFEGETGPYIQYTHARISSILKDVKDFSDWDPKLLDKDEDKQIILMLNNFEETLLSAAKNYRLSILTRYLLDLSQIFNEYYHKYHILTDDLKTRNSRLMLISKVRFTLKEGLNILGIKALERM